MEYDVAFGSFLSEEDNVAHQLPPLPYDFAALEPHIDAQTVPQTGVGPIDSLLTSIYSFGSDFPIGGLDGGLVFVAIAALVGLVLIVLVLAVVF